MRCLTTYNQTNFRRRFGSIAHISADAESNKIRTLIKKLISDQETDPNIISLNRSLKEPNNRMVFAIEYNILSDSEKKIFDQILCTSYQLDVKKNLSEVYEQIKSKSIFDLIFW